MNAKEENHRYTDTFVFRWNVVILKEESAIMQKMEDNSRLATLLFIIAVWLLCMMGLSVLIVLILLQLPFGS